MYCKNFASCVREDLLSHAGAGLLAGLIVITLVLGTALGILVWKLRLTVRLLRQEKAAKERLKEEAKAAPKRLSTVPEWPEPEEAAPLATAGDKETSL